MTIYPVRILLTLILFQMIVLPIMAGERVVVLPFRNSSIHYEVPLGTTAQNALIDQINHSKTLSAVKASKLADLLEKMRLRDLVGFVDDMTQDEIGKKLRADYVVSGEIMDVRHGIISKKYKDERGIEHKYLNYHGDATIKIRIYDIRTHGMLLYKDFQAKTYLSNVDGVNYRDALLSAVEAVAKKVDGVVFSLESFALKEGFVVKTYPYDPDNRYVLVDIGRNKGAYPGLDIFVYREGGVISNPFDPGFSEIEKDKIGMLTVTQVYKRYSKARINHYRDIGKFQIGDKATNQGW